MEFGTTGYTMGNIFVLYDRESDSVWYPLNENSFDAVSGPYKGKSLPFLEEPPVMRLHEWAAKHPDTLVLLPPPPSPRQKAQQERRRKLINRLTGTWAMESDTGQQVIEATMTIIFDGQGFAVTWESQDQEMPVLELRYDGSELKFKRQIPGGDWLTFAGTVSAEGTIEGVWDYDGREIPCTGTKTQEQEEAQAAAAAELIGAAVGRWAMATDFQGQSIDAMLILKLADGKLTGVWESMDMEMELYDVSFDGTNLLFKRSMGGQGEMVFEGTVEGDELTGVFSTGMGDLETSGKREEES